MTTEVIPRNSKPLAYTGGKEFLRSWFAMSERQLPGRGVSPMVPTKGRRYLATEVLDTPPTSP
ncbi:MAG: hypothetical protein JMM78_01920 [Candidatus Xiphinematobacter sp.]|nr:MAG: hypothetical protein JMM78_01920 [Candidatus Xiphinematobacter sp.]